MLTVKDKIVSTKPNIHNSTNPSTSRKVTLVKCCKSINRSSKSKKIDSKPVLKKIKRNVMLANATYIELLFTNYLSITFISFIVDWI